MYADCVIEYPVKTLDKSFIYRIPEELRGRISAGMKVLVPFNTRIVHGFVVKISEEVTSEYEIKEIIRIEDEFLVLNEELMELGYYLKECTLCNLITAYQTMLPSALKIKNQKSDYNCYEKFVELNVNERKAYEFIESHRGKKVAVLERLLDEGVVNKIEFEAACVRELEKLGLVKVLKKKKYRINKVKRDIEEKKLTEEQEQAFKMIKDAFGSYETFLMYGVTGSGKTLVYINLIREVVREGKTALLLVPEISLTKQIIDIFYDYFGSDVAILHSGLSKTEKYDEYVKILNKDVKIVVGTRSAVFAPLENIGIIIIDEEHSETYKQDMTPRYQAIEIAHKRCEYNQAPLVLGSATPSLESMARALKGVYKLVTLKKRVNKQVLPECLIVDMAQSVREGCPIISPELDKEIRRKLEAQEQIILLLNRRGFASISTCSSCGFTYKCPNCEISLTYHKSSNSLRCHYCGYTKLKDNLCPNCHEDGLNYLGTGTEKLESVVKTKYPNARIVRMDADTTTNKGAHEKIITYFREQEYDILIGTQMISKGLDFPKCTLVGVINADTTLNIPDFRSGERTFALIHQAAGRAGRGEGIGKVIIQTFNPDNPVINYVANNDYIGFYKREMQVRKMLKYPPYYFLVNVKVCSKDYNEAREAAGKVGSYLKRHIDETSIILGPSCAANFRLKNVYRFNITIKYKFDESLKKVLRELDEIYASNRNVFLEIDINPLQL